MSHRWTDEEREIVRQRYDGTRESADAIGKDLGLTFLQVRGQVQKLKLGHPSEKWSPEDLALSAREIWASAYRRNKRIFCVPSPL
jgi:hypothetical protein